MGQSESSSAANDDSDSEESSAPACEIECELQCECSRTSPIRPHHQGRLESRAGGEPIEVNPNGCSGEFHAPTCHKQTSPKQQHSKNLCRPSGGGDNTKNRNNNDIKLRNNNNNINSKTSKHHSKVASFNPLQLVKSLGKSGRVDVEQQHQASRMGGAGDDDIARRLSNVSQHRNIQLLSMKARSERETFVDDLRGRRRSSLINLILGAPSSGPRFCDDLCSLSSRLTNFGIEYFPDYNNMTNNQHLNGAGMWTCSSSVCGSLKSVTSSAIKQPNRDKKSQLRFSATESIISAGTSNETLATISSAIATHKSSQINEQVEPSEKFKHRRRSSEGSLAGEHLATLRDKSTKLANQALASIDLTSSFEAHLPPGSFPRCGQFNSSGDVKNMNKNDNKKHQQPKMKLMASKRRLNVGAHRFLRRSGSELSLYSNQSNGADSQHQFTWSRKASNDGVGVDESDFASQSSSSSSSSSSLKQQKQQTDSVRETKLLIILQVCLPFIFAGFGNMGAGLVLARLASWDVARYVTTFLVILPPLVGLKGNIEMTLASRLSTLANLNLLDTKYRRQRAYLSNLTLILSQAIGLSLFASIVAILCELAMSAYGLNTSPHHHHHEHHELLALINVNATTPLHSNDMLASTTLTFHANYSGLTTPTTQLITGNNTTSDDNVIPNGADVAHENKLDLSVQVLLLIASALTTSLIVVILSSFMMSAAILLAKLIQVNPDNLSTLIAALYGDCSFVLIYGLVASSMYKLMVTQGPGSLFQSVNLYAPSIIIACIVSLWPILLFSAYKFKETHSIALSSLPPMLVSIMISMGSGAVLSVVVKRFALLALYQPIVNGFSANLVAVQASRVSTWLWCSAIDSNVQDTNRSKNNNNNKKNNLTSFHSDLPKASKVLDSLASFVPDLGNNLKVAKTMELNMSGQSESKTQLGLKNCLKLISNCMASTKHVFLHKVCWSFTNKSPNSIAARLLLIMLIPAHTLYFLVIWLLFSASSSSAPSDALATTTIHLTWSFYLVYLSVCIIQVFLLFILCEPFMALLMKRGHDPDIIGISILMALADLTGTLFLTGAFYSLHAMGDINAR